MFETGRDKKVKVLDHKARRSSELDAESGAHERQSNQHDRYPDRMATNCPLILCDF